MKGHTTKCPAAIIIANQKAQSYYKQGINTFPEPVINLNYPEITDEELIWKIQNWWKNSKYFDNQNFKSITRTSIETQKKHKIQLNSLVEFIFSNLPEENNEIIGIEMGAGKGTLSAAIHNRNENFYHLLVDIQKNFRNKAEKSFNLDCKFKRIHVDIKDLHLSLAIDDQFQLDEKMNVILYAKHLCGQALDLSLHCIVSTLEKYKNSISVIAFASCCHHRCTWKNYCSMYLSFLFSNEITKAPFQDLSFLQNALEIKCSEKEFAKICSMTR